ncbi:ethanolamine ammonia-lyase subunit EutC [Sulfurospirillum sp. 1307]|jgi:ethanolamine ammonia-lyase small subunit
MLVKNPWDALKKFTSARIALGRSGVSIPTKELLDFQLAHARAMDAVHEPIDFKKVKSDLKKIGFCDFLELHSQAKNRETYLQRPDLGRSLDEDSKELLKNNKKNFDLVIVVADGLSSFAIEKNISKFLKVLFEKIDNSINIAPICLVKQARVAIADEIGEILNTKSSMILIGERPGLSSPDSMGLYYTYEPKIGLNDSNRNCISNIREEGLSYDLAVGKFLYLFYESFRLKFSGVNLKDRYELKSLKHDKSLTI